MWKIGSVIAEMGKVQSVKQMTVVKQHWMALEGVILYFYDPSGLENYSHHLAVVSPSLVPMQTPSQLFGRTSTES